MNAHDSSAHHHQSALALHHQIASGQCSAVSVLDATYATLKATEGALQAYTCLTEDLAYQTARNVDSAVSRGEKLPLLAGVPIAIKDNLNLTGYPTTCSSKMLASGYVSPYDATVCSRLKAHMMPIVGKTNLDEFAMGSSTENSALLKTKNPWDLNRVPGGSSGGSAATVGARQVLLSLGSDTGGSIRQPAALCGVVGIKPTYGLVSRYGLVAFASSLDQIGPFATTAEDAAALLDVLSGQDAMDATSKPESMSSHALNLSQKLLELPADTLKGLRVGVIAELSGEQAEGFEPDVMAAFEASVNTLKSLGATISTISIPSVKYGVAAYYIVAPAEASSNLARYDGVRYGLRVEEDSADRPANLHRMFRETRAAGFGSEVKRRIMLGTFALSAGYYDAYYGKAQQVRELLRHEFNTAWQQVDALICPTSPCTAFEFGSKSSDPIQMYLSDVATIPVNLAGIPALSIPCGFDHQGLPIGLQLQGPHWSELTLLQISRAFEKATSFSGALPPIARRPVASA
ncbi:MAG: Asp-tRNA(Asn)/Glu-tRNA(Gln) amidotransferase subunit GatA [Vampirovibrionales bacterium]|nr:Asp-tRNA(Asn)/Glu-tRNA(Gln) amidotransferase subunit GatA [Vampirovibrionales bacterium]